MTGKPFPSTRHIRGCKGIKVIELGIISQRQKEKDK